MPYISFAAPHLYDAGAPPLDDPTGMLHDAPGMLAPLGRQKRFAAWVGEQLRAAGRKVLGPQADESGWALQVNAEGGFVILFLGYEEKDAAFTVLIHGFDAQAAATSAYEDLQAILAKTDGARVVKADPDA